VAPFVGIFSKLTTKPTKPAWTVAPSVGLFSKLTTKPTKPRKPTENQRIFHSQIYPTKLFYLQVLYRLLLVVVIWRKSKKMNVDGVDSDSEIDEVITNTSPDIADEASAAKQDLLPKKSGDLYNIENVDHKVEDLYFFAFCERTKDSDKKDALFGLDT
jgi:hypothetical protein